MDKRECWEFAIKNKSNWPRMLERQYPDIWECVMSAPGIKPKEKLFNYVNSNECVKRCTCGAPCKWHSNNTINGYTKYCSTSCSTKATKEIRHLKIEAKRDQINQKFKETCMTRYGVPHFWSCQMIKDKTKTTVREKYGVDHMSQHESVKQKIKNTLVDRYNVTNASQIETAKTKRVQTMQQNGFLDEDGHHTTKLNDKIRATKVARGSWFDRDDTRLISSFKKYKRHIRYLTNKNLHEQKRYDLLETRNNQNHIDHMLSIKDGFLQKIPAWCIAHIVNLRMLSHADNIAKGSKSVITEEELMQKIARFEKDQNPS